jgi:DNA primase
MTDDTIRSWHIGWGPNDWQALNGFLKAREVSGRDAATAGLVSEKNGRSYDRFRGRIMFPICDVNGQTIGFAGRIFGRAEDTQEPKYINTPQTPLYDKGRVLFGLHMAKMAIRDRDACVLVEGNTDAIMSWQAGVRNAVATSGTALTDDQLRLLSRYSKNLDFCFDVDLAGAAATRRGIALALAHGEQVRIATLSDEQSMPSERRGGAGSSSEQSDPSARRGSAGSSSEQCKDPADYVRIHGEGFRDVIANAKPVVQYYLDEALRRYDPASASSKRAVMAAVGPFIKEIPSRVEAAHWTARLSAVLRVPEQDVRADLAALPREVPETRTVREEPSKKESAQPTTSAPDPLEQAALAIMMSDVVSLHGLLGELDRAWVSPAMQTVLDNIASRKPEDIEWNRFLDEYADGTWRLDFAHTRAQEVLRDTTEDERKRQWRLAVARLGRRYLEHKASALELEIKAAEDAQDTQRVSALLNDFSQLKHTITNLFRIT